ncbi:MAG: type II toxin-antitoxin system RelE/ParE family toxin [Thermodesulfobacteriota bacterium]
MSKPTTWTVVIQGPEKKYLSKLPRPEQERIFEALTRLEEDPFVLDLKRLKGQDVWRLRIGRWRALLKFDHDQRRIVLVGLGPRGDVYK